MTIEYRIKPVVRYYITRHEQTENAGSTQHIGSEYSSGEVAFEVAYALAHAEAERLGLAPGSMNLIYPTQPIEYELRPNPHYGGVEELVFKGRAPNRHDPENTGLKPPAY